MPVPNSAGLGPVAAGNEARRIVGTGERDRQFSRLSETQTQAIGAELYGSTEATGHNRRASPARDRAWWRGEARRGGSDWPGVLALHVEVVNTWRRRHDPDFNGSAVA